MRRTGPAGRCRRPAGWARPDLSRSRRAGSRTSPDRRPDNPRPAEHHRPAERPDQPAKPGTALALRNEPTPKRKATGPEADLAEFAKDLRDLRTEAGLGYPEMAELSHYTMKTLASAAGGLTLPTLPVMAAYVRACDGNVAEWEDRWHRLSDTVEPARRGTTAEPGAAADGTAGPGTAGPGTAGPGTAGPGTAGPSTTEPGRSAGAAPDRGAGAGAGQGDEARQDATPQGTPRRRTPRPSQVSSPRPAREGPSDPDPVPSRPPGPGPDQVYVITSAAPRRPYR